MFNRWKTMRVIKTNNQYYRFLKSGKKHRIKKKIYLKFAYLDNYDSDGDYKMEEQQNELVSILKKTKKGTNTEIWSDEQVRFNDSNNEIREYYLSPEEKMDKSLHVRAINKKRKYFY